MASPSTTSSSSLPTDWVFERLSPAQQKDLLREALEQQLRQLKRQSGKPPYWQRVNLHYAIDFFSNGFYPTALLRLRDALSTKPPAIPQLEKEARAWDVTHLESSLRAALLHPKRTPRGA